MDDILAMILAGGEGRRLYPLTMERAKPAVPFGGRYRIIDFVINNFINSGVYKIKILTQFKSDSLNRHITRAWPVTPILGQFIDLVPAQMRTGENWYRGTADAIYQNINIIEDINPNYVCVFGGDHIYYMDVRQKMDFHKDNNSVLTISGIPVPIQDAKQFGVMEVDENYRLIGFEEKTENPKPIPGQPDKALVSMGNYIFNKDVLLRELYEDYYNETSSHDFGKDIITSMFSRERVFVYNFMSNEIKGLPKSASHYWRDVGSIFSYWQANMDLISINPSFNLYNKHWPIRTYVYHLPPAKFVWSANDRMGIATDSMVSEGSIISGGHIHSSILAPNVRINSFSNVRESILFEGVNVGRHAEIQRAIIDKYVNIPPYTKIGWNKEEDLSRGFIIDESGITVVPKGIVFT